MGGDIVIVAGNGSDLIWIGWVEADQRGFFLIARKIKIISGIAISFDVDIQSFEEFVTFGGRLIINNVRIASHREGGGGGKDRFLAKQKDDSERKN